MPIARSSTIALVGMHGALVDIEVDLADGIPAFALIGLPDTALGEARQRVRSAAANSGCELPNKKFTVNLSPAALPKHGSGFDLGIARMRGNPPRTRRDRRYRTPALSGRRRKEGIRSPVGSPVDPAL